MARTWFKNKQLTRQTLTGTVTPASVLSLSFTPKASTSYYLLWSAQCDYNITTRNCAFALNDTTGSVALAAISNRTDNNSNIFSIGGIAKWTAGGSPGTQQFDITQAPGNSADTVGSDEIFLMAIEAQATDAYAEVLSANTRTSSTLGDQCTLTFTPGSAGDYLILCSAEAGGLITATSNGCCRVLLDVNGTQYFDTVDGQQANTSSARYAWAGAMVLNFAASSQTLKIQFASSDNTNTANIRNCRILCMRLDTFAQATTAQNTTEQSTQQTTMQVAATVTPTVPNNDYIVLSSGLVRYSTSARNMESDASIAGVTRSLQKRYQMFTGGVRKTSYIGWGYDTLVGGSRTFQTEWRATNASDTAYITGAFIGALLPVAVERSFVPTVIG